MSNPQCVCGCGQTTAGGGHRFIVGHYNPDTSPPNIHPAGMTALRAMEIAVKAYDTISNHRRHDWNRIK